MAAPRPVVVVGDLMVDVVAAASEPLAHGSDAAATVTWSGGGAGANVAAWLADAGVPCALVARVGDDLAGRGAVQELEAAGVDVTGVAVDPTRATGTCVCLVEVGGERTMLPDRGANAALRANDLPAALLTPGAWLHLSGYVLLGPARDAGLAVLAAARAAGMRTSIDPASVAPLRAAGIERAREDLRGSDLLLPNAEEAALLTGLADPAAAARALAELAGEVVVTGGADGAWWSDGAEVVRAPAGSVGAVVDTTGAGDAFCAGFLAERSAGAAPADALAAGSSLGARAVARAGARP